MFPSFSGPTGHLSGVRFSLYSEEEIRKLSVKCVTNAQTFDQFSNPTYGGLYDPAFGPTERDDLCSTCGQNNMHCPGHFGHIELKLPVYHPLFLKLLVTILRSTCFQCHRMSVEKGAKCLFECQMRALDYGLLADTMDLEAIANSATVDYTGSSIILQDVITDAVQNRLKESLEKIENKKQTKKSSCGKNVTELRNKLIKDFIREKLAFKAKKCIHCGSPRRNVKIEYNSKIYLKALSSRQASSWESVSRLSKSSQNLQSNVTTNSVTNEDLSNVGFEEEEYSDEETSEKTPISAKTPPEATVGDETGDIVKSVQQAFVTPIEVQQHLRKVWENEEVLLNALLGSYPSPTSSKRKSSPQMFFLNVVPVPPSRFRPLSVMGEKKFDNPQSANLTKVLEDCQVLRYCLDQIKQARSNENSGGTNDLASITSSRAATPALGAYDRLPGETPDEKLQNAWVRLQNDVNCFIDSDLDKIDTNQTSGIKQLLEKKEGLFRKHMMGKRVNYAARSVISPDPYINTDQIGIPEVFAKKLTYPQPVTPWNVKELRQRVLNGPNVHPGANMVESEDGKKTLLSATDPNQRHAIARRLLTPSDSSLPLGRNKKVYRHLQDGDVLLLNRQPTLHKPSIMAHKARVLKGEKTIRLHYANCKAYNADFDGDEMNAHFPQNELARSEAYSIASTNFQYLIPKDGKPVSGLIQDHMVSGVSLTTRGRFFNKLDYQQLVFCALATITNRRFQLLKPAIIKPQELWSGKQVVSTILINIIPKKCKKLNLHGKSKIPAKSWVTGTPRYGLANEMCESQVIIRDGELLCGVLDKAHYGSTPFSLIHCCYELYGGVVSSLLLSALARVFTAFLQMRGFSLGVEDIIVKEKPDRRRRKVMKEGRRCGHEVATRALGLPEDTESEVLIDRFQAAHHSRDGSDMKELDLKMKSETDRIQDQINKCCIPVGLLKRFPENNLQLMVQSGAKGSVVNCMQISCLLGQIELEGRRPPLMISGRSLPSFLPYDPSPRAGGFVDGRFLTGIRPQEYFFHCMAGREGLVDTAVKTSRSGYLQRCLIKHLEGLHVGYDLTVRDSDGSVVQFYYGEDGLDVLKTACLSEKQFPFMASNYKALITQLRPRKAVARLDASSAEKYRRKLDRWIKKNDHSPGEKRPRVSSLSCFMKETNLAETPSTSEERDIWTVDKDVIDAWRSAPPQNREKYTNRLVRAPDPVLSKMSPACHVGAVSEKFHGSLMKYITTNPDNCLTDQPGEYIKQLSAEKFQILMHLKALRSLAEPGEGVGLLAAQSIGEPSTQMTLNTFHFAGRGEMNVTLGIPRMREILMTASANIKTPTMEVPLRSGKKPLKKAKQLKIKFAKVLLSQVLQNVEVWETLSSKNAGTRYRMYRIRFQFLPQDAYQGELFVTPESILIYMETIFFKKLTTAISRVIRATQRANLLDTTTREKNSDQNEPGEDAGDQNNDTLNPSSKYDEDDDNADLSEEEADADGDATGEKNKKKREQHASYEAPDQDEEEINKELVESEDSDSEDETNASQMQDKGDMEVTEVPPQSKEINPAHDKRVTNVMLNNPNIASYCFDEESQEWCEVQLRFPVTGSKVMLTTLMEKLASQSVIYETPGITRSFLVENKDKPSMFKTEGVNLKVMWGYPEVLEIDKLYTNDTHQVAKTYGIEAAGRVIATEIKNVFGAYGIEVDPRHLTLVADYMTYEGCIKAFNRIGIESNASPFQKMSFETTMHFLRGATITGATEQLASPSSRLVVGRVVGGGTGSFDLKLPLC